MELHGDPLCFDGSVVSDGLLYLPIQNNTIAITGMYYYTFHRGVISLCGAM